MKLRYLALTGLAAALLMYAAGIRRAKSSPDVELILTKRTTGSYAVEALPKTSTGELSEFPTEYYEDTNGDGLVDIVQYENPEAFLPGTTPFGGRTVKPGVAPVITLYRNKDYATNPNRFDEADSTLRTRMLYDSVKCILKPFR